MKFKFKVVKVNLCPSDPTSANKPEFAGIWQNNWRF